jgi:hypothetical protein
MTFRNQRDFEMCMERAQDQLVQDGIPQCVHNYEDLIDGATYRFASSLIRAKLHRHMGIAADD